MRLTRLDLQAFGPFTGQILSFDSDLPGLHIIFGPNEAGKSSSLRALKALLYGFPERTSDNFRHANDQLRVGGRLLGEDGRELIFVRRKKRKADLLNPDGSPMDDGMLAAFLHGIDPALFESLYGIDHKTLVDGGEDILGQKGEVGRALFAAGAGISSLKKILDDLDADAEALFKARGSTPKINKALKEYNELKKIVKAASLPSATWKEHRKRKKDAEEEQAGLENERTKKSAEVKRLGRLHRAIPQLAQLENLKTQKQALGDVVLLPPEFADQVRQAEQAIRETKLQCDKDKNRLEKLTAERDAIQLNPALLDHAQAIEDLHQRLGEYRKGSTDRSKLEGMRISCRTDAATLLKTVRPDLALDDADSLRPVLGRKRLIQTLSSRHEALTQQAIHAQEQKEDAQKALLEVTKQLSGLSPPGESDGLAGAIRTARSAGDLDGQIDGLVRRIDAEKKACRAAIKRFGLWSGDLELLPELPLPLPETVRRFERRCNALENAVKQLDRDRTKAEEDLKKAGTDHREAVFMGEIPTEQDLEASRKKREEGWQLLRRRWIDGEDISKAAKQYAPDLPLHDAYERQVEQADHLADRLRREADRVAKAASLTARIETLENAIRKFLEQEQALDTREKDLSAEWRSLWEPVNIHPLSPMEMIAWLTDIDKLQSRVSEIMTKEDEVSGRDAARQQYRKALADALKALGEPGAFEGNKLSPVLVHAETVLEKIVGNRIALEQLKEKKAQLQRTFDKAEKARETAETAAGKWTTAWNNALSGLGFEAAILPAQALDLIETMDACFAKLEKAREFASRIKGIDRDMENFSADAGFLITEAAPDLKHLPLDQAVLSLNDRLGQARENHNLLKKNNAEADGLSAEIKNAEKTLNSLDGRMAELIAKAGCDRTADLADAIEKSEAYRRLQEKISDADAALAKTREGVPITEIKQQADKVSVDELPGQIASLMQQIDDELYPRIKEISKIIGEENRELKLMDGSARAAEAAEKTAQVAAGIQRMVDQYTRIKVAAMVLKNEIERYREKHQDPVLQVASSYFSELTIGSFTGLRTDVDDKGTPVLVGVRPDNARLSVDKMSDGTRDQLYLALRLATLESRLENSEPMPFIVDDILINFDDARTRATLGVLSKLAKKNQVILFTHHRQVVDASRNISEKGVVHVHELGPG